MSMIERGCFYFINKHFDKVKCSTRQNNISQNHNQISRPNTIVLHNLQVALLTSKQELNVRVFVFREID